MTELYAIYDAGDRQISEAMSEAAAEAALMTALEYGEVDIYAYVGVAEDDGS